MIKNKFNEPWVVVSLGIVQADGDLIAEFFEGVMNTPGQNERACSCVNALKGLRPEELPAFIKTVVALAEEDCNLDCDSETCKDTPKCLIRDFKQALAALRIPENVEEGP